MHQRRTNDARYVSRGDSGELPETVRVRMLGGFAVSVGLRDLGERAWRLRKAASLVKLLALAPEHCLHCEQAIDLLWPNLGRRAASNNLRRVLHTARRILDPAAGSRYLASKDEQLVLCPKGELWVDVEAFEEAAATARRSRDLAAYRVATELYAGDLLPADRYEEWADGRRQELRRTFLSLLFELAKLRERHEDYDPAIEALGRVVAEEPTNEEAHAGLMRLYALSGRRGEALKQHEHLEEALSRGLGTEPAASSRALKEEIEKRRFPPSSSSPTRATSEDDAPALSAAAARHNLPAARTSFVGREREMLAVKRAFAMTRLLTLTGFGGSGKSRLALEVARNLVGVYPDGVWLVELAPLSEGELVPQAVANALGIQERPGQPLANTLIDALRARQMLLVLDNCEHLIDAVALLVDTLLVSCPNLRVLATSREALDVAGEVRWIVPSLSVPDSRRSLTVEELESYESVRLFVERASSRRSGFELRPENTHSVAQICERLDGIPLAIELAAARMGTLSVEQISERLTNSLKLLTSGGRTAPPRHRTLRGTLDWSHDLLGEPERALFRRLSVFAGGWTLGAAEAVGGEGGVEDGEVLDLLSELVEKSLVVFEADGESGMRYRMLEPVRQYAREKLEEEWEANKIRRRHADFFVALAEQEPEAGLVGPEQATWLHRLEVEHDNFRMALSWALEQGEAELGLRLGAALGGFWQRQGYWSEGQTWLEAALSLANESPSSEQAMALARVGWLAWEQGDNNRALVSQEESLALYRGSEDVEGVAYGLNNLGWLTLLGGDFDRATELLEESLRRFRELGNREIEVADTLRALAFVASSNGNLIRAAALAEEALASCHEQGDSAGVAKCLHNLGWITMLRGDHARATELLEESLKWFEKAQQITPSYALVTLSLATLGQGDYERARRVLQEALALVCELGGRVNAPLGLEATAMLATLQGKSERAARLWGAAQSLREAIARPLRPDEYSVYEPYLAAARADLDDSIWEAGCVEGRRMTHEEAVEFALSEIGTDQSAPCAPERPRDDERSTILTRREQEVATLVARGLSNRRIAEELCLSERTVENHVANILKKLNLRSREHVASLLSDH
jgi:predicted ATPase/DNA-binding SARP family transcriptional activator/DNA-binding CsgD family transcriptional regulator